MRFPSVLAAIFKAIAMLQSKLGKDAFKQSAATGIMILKQSAVATAALKLRESAAATEPGSHPAR